MPSDDGPTLALILFRLQGQTLAVEASRVLALLPSSSLNASTQDLARLLGLPPATITIVPGKRRILRLSDPHAVTGTLDYDVEEPVERRSFPPARIRPRPPLLPCSPLVRAFALGGDEIIPILALP